MDNKKRKKLLLVAIIFNFLFFLIAILTPIAFNKSAENNAKSVNIVNGEINFRYMDISNGNTYLDGEWKFYPNQWIVTDKDSIDSPYFEYLNPKKSISRIVKYASYQITLAHFSISDYVTLNVSNTRCAYRIFVNGQKCFESGKLSKTHSVSEYTYTSKTFILDNLINTSTDIVIEISNSYTNGLQVVPVLSNYNRTSLYSNVNVFIMAIALGLLFSSLLCFFAGLIIEKKSFTIITCFSLFLTLFGVFLFIPPGVSIMHFLFSFNYEVSYLAIYILTLFIYGIISVIILDKLKSDKMITTRKYSVIPISVLSICLVISIPLFFTGLFDQSAKILLAVATVVPLLVSVYILFLFFKKNYDSNFLFINLQLLTTLSVALPIIFYSITNIYQIKYYFASWVLIFILFFGVCLSISYNKKKKIQKHLQEIDDLKETINQSNASILLSQIRPHFLYNTLNTIVYLCRTNPKKAEDAIISFSKYLRANMNSLDKKEVIPFDQELTHIQNYVKIEQLRFGQKLKVTYSLKYLDFKVPPLSIQPIVENAIKHGITKRADGGKLFISTRADDNYIYITIEDTGVGFDVKETFDHYKSNSIGLHNITKRLKMMSNGTITFDSKIGVGTKVNIKIPKP